MERELIPSSYEVYSAATIVRRNERRGRSHGEQPDHLPVDEIIVARLIVLLARGGAKVDESYFPSRE